MDPMQTPMLFVRRDTERLVDEIESVSNVI